MDLVQTIEFVDPSTKAKLPLTRAQSQRRYIKNHPGQKFTIDLTMSGHADVLYIMEAWGIPNRRRAVLTAIKYLAKLTRDGLDRIDLTTD